jgi:hypothetical protein
MNASPLCPWIEVVSLHPDVLSEDFSEAMFALDLGPLAAGNPNVPVVYRDPEQFFRASYLTSGLRSLLQDVLSRLAGGHGNRVLKLVTPFGGGKSHTLAALFHAAGKRAALDVIPEGQSLPRVEGVRLAVCDGQFFDAVDGKAMPGEDLCARTMWGWIAWSLGSKDGYELVRRQDEARVAPGGDVLIQLLGDRPNLILLDECLEYLISAGGVKVGETTLRDETLNFLKRLIVAVGNVPNSALVFSLPASNPRQTLGYVGLFNAVNDLASRKDQLREPVEGNEILAVIQRRLLSGLIDPEQAGPAAVAYQEIVTQMRRAYARTTAEQQQAEEEGLALRDRVRAAYPFHPALIDLMRERWAAIPEFQRTRGVLRFLAACLRAAHREGQSRVVLGPGEVPIHDAEVRLAFFKEVGQQADLQAVLEHDLVGANARARRIDERRAREIPAERARKPAARLATAILMYSFGGLRREGGDDGGLLPPGVSEAELLAACVGPDLDSTTAQACLKELREQCLYLHFDGVRYCFKKDPNVTLLVEQEADMIGRDVKAVRERIKELLEARLAGHRTAIVWPEKSADIPEKDPAFLVAYLPLELAGKPKGTQEAQALELLEKYGDRPRPYRNGLGAAMPAGDQVEILRRSVIYLMAMEQIKGKARQHNLTDEQKSQLNERERTERAAAESAFLKLYTEVWLPRVEEGGKIGLEKVAIGGRPLQTTLNLRKEAMVHERVMELLTVVQPRVFGSIKPAKIIELFRLGEGEPPRLGIRTAEAVDGFYSFLGFTRLTTSAAIRKGIGLGIQEGRFGYVAGAVPEMGPEGKYQVPANRVRLNTAVAEDEIDLESGFLVLPQAIPMPAPAAAQGVPPATARIDAPLPEGWVGPKPVAAGVASVVAEGSRSERTVELTFAVDRSQLYTAWNAVANLADLAGRVSVVVRAESAEGFDRGRLQNGVIEPLQEAGLIE